MNKEFKDKVIQDGITFKTGHLDCNLKIDRKVG
jgi:hypothetical protein